MKSPVVLMAACAVALAGLTASSPVTAGESAAPTPQAATRSFYAALNRMFKGDVGPMEKVWSHREDVTYMGPGGDYLVGWPQVRREWQRQAAQGLGGRVEPQHTRVVAGRDLAVVTTVEVGENSVAGQRQTVVIRATNVFRSEAGGWKMIGHHTDLLPYIRK